MYFVTLLMLGSSICYIPAKCSKPAKKHHKLLLVSFDGMRWDFPARAPQLEGFKRLRENGVKAKFVKPVFPTLTSPCHFSIATGLHVESHGVVHNDYYNASEGGGVWNKGDYYSTQIIDEWWDQGGEPIWITAEKQGLRTGTYNFPGGAASIGGYKAHKIVVEKAPTPLNEQIWRDRITETVKWLVDEHLDMAAIYFDEPDIKTHQTGPDDVRVAEELLPILSRIIVHLLDDVEAAGLTDDLNIIITSDHGFTNLENKESDTISLTHYVNMSHVDFMLSSTPLTLIEPKTGFLDEVYNDLKAANRKMAVYKKEDIPERWHFKNNDRITSIVVVGNLGHNTYSGLPPQVPYRGQHGFDNDAVDMWTIFYSIGPSFKNNLVVDGFESIHIYPLMCHLLGLTPAPNNGSLATLINCLKTPMNARFEL